MPYIDELMVAISEALAVGVKAHALPTVCEALGLAPGEGSGAFTSKRQYVLVGLKAKDDAFIVALGSKVAKTYDDYSLDDLLRKLASDGRQDISQLSLRQPRAGGVRPSRLAAEQVGGSREGHHPTHAVRRRLVGARPVRSHERSECPISSSAV